MGGQKKLNLDDGQAKLAITDSNDVNPRNIMLTYAKKECPLQIFLTPSQGKLLVEWMLKEKGRGGTEINSSTKHKELPRDIEITLFIFDDMEFKCKWDGATAVRCRFVSV